MNLAQEQQLNRESERGAKASRLLKDDLFNEAWSIVENDILEKWKTSPVRDQEGQFALRLKWQCLAEVRKILEDALQTGRLADESIRQEMTMRQKLREVGGNAMDAARGILRTVRHG